MVPKEYYGRLFTKEQLPVDYHSEAFTLESMIKVDKQLRCKRCYSQIEEDWQLPGGQYYCRACIVFGRNQEGKELYYFPSKTSEIEFPVLKWLGELTPYQAEVSEKLLETYQKQKDSLVHAVTGAGMFVESYFFVCRGILLVVFLCFMLRVNHMMVVRL